MKSTTKIYHLHIYSFIKYFKKIMELQVILEL